MPQPIKLKAGLVGAGEACAHHIAALRRLKDVAIVGLHDIKLERAESVGAELGVPAMPSLAALHHAGANVIHVLTPPDTHAQIALKAMDLGCHVYVEKPATVDVADCRTMEHVASARGLQVCVGHSLLFDPQVRQALNAVRGGSLGRVVAVDYLRSASYPPFEGGTLPAPYRSAGYPFRDLGAHALYLFEAFLGPIEHVQADWKSIGGAPNLAFDEWRAQVRCRDGMAQCQLSWNVRPMQNQLMIQGTRGVRRVDMRPRFGASHANRGLHALVAEFYRALEVSGQSPVTLSDAKRVVQWTERVARLAEQDHHLRVSHLRLRDRVPVLVTGASGAVGRAVVARLRDEGKHVRVFVRRPPATPTEGVEVAVGDLGDADAVDRAVRGAEVVIHAGAAMRGAWENFRCATIVGTQNVIDACLRNDVNKLVHVSSLSVLDWAGADRAKSPVTESAALEPHAERRGHYSRSKLEAELLVSDAVRSRGLRAIIVRPGQIFGGSIPLLTPAVARRFAKRWIVLGDGRQPLPLIHMDDVVEAICRAARCTAASGEIVHLVEADSPTQNDVLEAVLGTEARLVHVPRALVIAGGAAYSALLRLVERTSPVSVYRLRSAMSRCRFASTNAALLQGWQPTVRLPGALSHMSRATKPQPTGHRADSTLTGRLPVQVGVDVADTVPVTQA